MRASACSSRRLACECCKHVWFLARKQLLTTRWGLLVTAPSLVIEIDEVLLAKIVWIGVSCVCIFVLRETNVSGVCRCI